jgi:C4-type Zn-finger protein
MKIKQILSQHRRDFTAIMVCEHCDKEIELKSGYDDTFYHNSVIPNMVCKGCGKSSGADYRLLQTKYDDGVVV